MTLPAGKEKEEWPYLKMNVEKSIMRFIISPIRGGIMVLEQIVKGDEVIIEQTTVIFRRHEDRNFIYILLP